MTTLLAPARKFLSWVAFYSINIKQIFLLLLVWPHLLQLPGRGYTKWLDKKENIFTIVGMATLLASTKEGLSWVAFYTTDIERNILDIVGVATLIAPARENSSWQIFLLQCSWSWFTAQEVGSQHATNNEVCTIIVLCTSVQYCIHFFF